MSVKNKKEGSVFEKKNLVVLASAAILIIGVAFGMRMLLPDDEKTTTFDSSAWEEAVQEAENVMQEVDAVTENEAEESAVATTAGGYPTDTNADATETEAKTETETETEETQSGEETEENAVTTNNAATAPNTLIFVRPVNGSVTKDYSGDELVYSETMQDWRTHNGIDFSAEKGADVVAAADGTVEAVTENSMMGKTIVILHSGGVRTIYSNLDNNNHIETGADVAKGAVIGKIGGTAAAEVAEPSHLHFEVSLNEETVNPHDYLPKE